MGMPVIRIIASIAVRSGMISTYRTEVFQDPGKQEASIKTTSLCNLLACHEVIPMVEMRYGMTVTLLYLHCLAIWLQENMAFFMLLTGFCAGDAANP